MSELEKQVKMLEHNMTVMAGMVHTDDGGDKIKELEQKIEIFDNAIRVHDDQINTLSAVIFKLLKSRKGFELYDELIKQLAPKGVEGEPSLEYYRKRLEESYKTGEDIYKKSMNETMIELGMKEEEVDEQ